MPFVNGWQATELFTSWGTTLNTEDLCSDVCSFPFVAISWIETHAAGLSWNNRRLLGCENQPKSFQNRQCSAENVPPRSSARLWLRPEITGQITSAASHHQHGIINIWILCNKKQKINLSRESDIAIMQMAHDSYSCEKFPDTRPYPTQRKDGLFVGGRKFQGVQLNIPCPLKCRPANATSEWTYCWGKNNTKGWPLHLCFALWNGIFFVQLLFALSPDIEVHDTNSFSAWFT